jgi:hypothetical protein
MRRGKASPIRSHALIVEGKWGFDNLFFLYPFFSFTFFFSSFILLGFKLICQKMCPIIYIYIYICIYIYIYTFLLNLVLILFIVIFCFGSLFKIDFFQFHHSTLSWLGIELRDFLCFVFYGFIPILWPKLQVWWVSLRLLWSFV